MGMSMSLDCCQEWLYMETHSATVFPKVDDLLEDTDYQEALNFAGRRKNMDKYRSMVDFLLCETLLHFRRPCYSFYRGKGPPIRDMGLEEWRLRSIEERLLRVLRAAKAWMDVERKASWKQISKEEMPEEKEGEDEQQDEDSPVGQEGGDV